MIASPGRRRLCNFALVVVVVVVVVVAIHCIALLTFTGVDSYVPPLSPLLMSLSYRLPKCCDGSDLAYH